MSEEQLKAFIAKVQADTTLQEQLKAEGADPVAIAKDAGFAITTEDLNTHRQDLSDEELEEMMLDNNNVKNNFIILKNNIYDLIV